MLNEISFHRSLWWTGINKTPLWESNICSYCKLYLFNFQNVIFNFTNVFVQFDKYLCLNYKLYLSWLSVELNRIPSLSLRWAEINKSTLWESNISVYFKMYLLNFKNLFLQIGICICLAWLLDEISFHHSLSPYKAPRWTGINKTLLRVKNLIFPFIKGWIFAITTSALHGCKALFGKNLPFSFFSVSLLTQPDPLLVRPYIFVQIEKCIC